MDEDKVYEFLDLYRNPEQFGKPKDFDVEEEGFSESCGDNFTVYLKFDGDSIRDVHFEGSGCIISTVSISKLCSALRGRRRSSVPKMGIDDVKKLLGVKTISMSRARCATVGLDAIKLAVEKTGDE
jgi:NifU-like protein involved in Fe-S cluster formation